MTEDASRSRVRPVVGRALALRCPRCGGTPLFLGRFRMREACGRCGLRFEKAQGYWVGAIYVNYAVTATLALALALGLWGAGAGIGWALAVAVAVSVVVPLAFFRHSRSLWLALEHLLNPEP